MVPPRWMLEIYNMPRRTPIEKRMRSAAIDKSISQPRMLAGDNSAYRRFCNNLRIMVNREPYFESRKMRMLYSQNPIFK
ncbi:hypothetical protein HN747_01485 [archaeon]|nr:hypothetical protein [archaeon]